MEMEVADGGGDGWLSKSVVMGRSFALYIDLNGEPVDMSLSEFLVHLSTMDNDSKKVNEVVDFILNLEEELRTIASSEYQLPNCMRFLKDAIATLQNEKWKCARRIKKKETKLLESNLDIARGTRDNNENKNMNEKQIDDISAHSFLENEASSDTLDLIRSESSLQDEVLEPIVQPEYIRPDPNVVLEVTRRQRMVWSANLHRKFRFAVEALGGPKEFSTVTVEVFQLAFGKCLEIIYKLTTSASQAANNRRAHLLI
ncbi:transcription factor HRS1 [Lactuca sativa]|uniref:transcription factor HRS1 n=1 Tax=Lactuca sativa TaxID=4236 RepID=UPI000CD8D8C2|nr:transcription factor HRS1 [Lactuca sativa]